MRQAYDYWQDQPGNCLSRSRNENTEVIFNSQHPDICPPELMLVPCIRAMPRTHIRMNHATMSVPQSPSVGFPRLGPRSGSLVLGDAVSRSLPAGQSSTQTCYDRALHRSERARNSGNCSSLSFTFTHRVSVHASFRRTACALHSELEDQ